MSVIPRVEEVLAAITERKGEQYAKQLKLAMKAQTFHLAVKTRLAGKRILISDEMLLDELEFFLTLSLAGVGITAEMVGEMKIDKATMWRALAKDFEGSTKD